MPEATIMCVDSSDYMRNGDVFPTRLMGTQEACNLLVGAKMSANPENTVAFLTMGGKACTVRETLTADTDRVMASMTSIPVSGTLHFIHGLQIASLALSHRTNPRAEKRIIAVVGSPLTEEKKALDKLAKRLRKDSVAVDIVCVAIEENIEPLTAFVDLCNKDNNSRFLHVPANSSLTDAVVSSPILLGAAAAEAGSAAAAAPGGAGAAGGMGGGFDFGVDPNVDPELAMVLRMSLEEERRRVEAAAAAEGGGGGGSDQPPKPEDPDAAATTALPQGGERVLTADEEFELALKMSLEEAQGGASSSSGGEEKKEAAPDGAAEFQAAIDDPAFMAQLAADIGVKPEDKKEEGKGDEKDPDDANNNDKS